MQVASAAAVRGIKMNGYVFNPSVSYTIPETRTNNESAIIKFVLAILIIPVIINIFSLSFYTSSHGKKRSWLLRSATPRILLKRSP